MDEKRGLKPDDYFESFAAGLPPRCQHNMAELIEELAACGCPVSVAAQLGDMTEAEFLELLQDDQLGWKWDHFQAVAQLIVLKNLHLHASTDRPELAETWFRLAGRLPDSSAEPDSEASEAAPE